MTLKGLDDIYAIPLLQGLRSNTYLKTLVLGFVCVSHQQLRSLTDSIPLMRIKKLKIDVDGDRYVEEEDAKQLLLQAVKNNFSLRSVRAYIRRSGLFWYNNIFNAGEKKILVFYTDRNEHLDHWVNNPERVDRKVWPEALKLADQAGPDSLFRGLNSVLGSDSASLPNGSASVHSITLRSGHSGFWRKQAINSPWCAPVERPAKGLRSVTFRCSVLQKRALPSIPQSYSSVHTYDIIHTQI